MSTAGGVPKIGARKPAKKATGMGAKKSGLGAAKVGTAKVSVLEDVLAVHD